MHVLYLFLLLCAVLFYHHCLEELQTEVLIRPKDLIYRTEDLSLNRNLSHLQKFKVALKLLCGNLQNVVS